MAADKQGTVSNNPMRTPQVAGVASGDCEERGENERPLVVLTLGMVWSSEEQVKELESSSPAWRDYNRLVSLQRVLPSAEIHSVTHNNHSLLTVATSHNLNIGRRGASTLHWKLRPDLQFDLVICDYFRFPCEYMREAYEGLLTFLQELHSKNRMAHGFKLLLPNLQRLKIFKDEQLFTSFNSIHHLDLDETSRQHPLYLATDKLEKQSDGVNRFLSGYCNETELKQLDPEFPFISCSAWVETASNKGQPLAKATIAERVKRYVRALEHRRRVIRENKGLKVRSAVRHRSTKKPGPKEKSRITAPKMRSASLSLKRKRCDVPEPVEFYTIVKSNATSFSKRLVDGRCKRPQKVREILENMRNPREGQEIDKAMLKKLGNALKEVPALRTQMQRLCPFIERFGDKRRVEFIRTYLNEINRRYPPDSDVNKTFINILAQYKNGDIKSDMVLKRIAVLFTSDEDLVLGFARLSDQQVISQVEKVVVSCLSAVLSPKASKKRHDGDLPAQPEEVSALLHVKQQLKSEEAWQSVLKCLDLYNQNLLTPVELGSLLSAVLPLRLLHQVNLLVASSVGTQRSHPFSQIEDDKLLDAVCESVASSTLNSVICSIEGMPHHAKGPPNWIRIAVKLKSRTPAECKLRWEEHVDPSINYGLWTAAEDLKLLGHYIEGTSSFHLLKRKMAGRTRRQIAARLEVVKELYKSLRIRQDAEPTSKACALSNAVVMPPFEDIPVIPREALLEIVELLRQPAELEQFLSHFHLDLKHLSYTLEANIHRQMNTTA